ncbi:MAG: MerR family transcriptional regulator [Acidimicrobiia bacterium]|nr:MerR family transcriptional regulator [Acidimicrobiia bacterium]MCY4456738.1 MerR family transcriptional regulator [Acidimicrobiaceae bacterium]
MSEQGFSSKRTAEIAGITYRQLDYWAREGIVCPSLTPASGSGSRRKYSYRDLLELRVIKTLLDSGIRLEQIRRGLDYLRHQLGEDVTSANLVINGSNSIVVNTGEELVDLLRAGQGVLNVLPLGNVKESLDARIVDLFGERASGKVSVSDFGVAAASG